MRDVINGILLPLAGTSFGSACVFFMSGELNKKLCRRLYGFAAGVMCAASVWSLLIPAMERKSSLGSLSFLPAVIGFWMGIIFLIVTDKISMGTKTVKKKEKNIFLLIFAVVIHNIPEGMAVGAIYASALENGHSAALLEAFALSLGISIQNFPEGAIISMPLKSAGKNRMKAFAYGVLSGVVEPIFAVLTLAAASVIVPALPYFLGFAAGAMIFVSAKELIPESMEEHGGYYGILSFCLGFTLMMTLDCALS